MSEKGKNAYGQLHVMNSTHLYFEEVLSSNGRVIDRFYLTQARHGPFVPNISCNASSGVAHTSCFCPPIFPYITIGLVIGVFVIFLILFCTYICRKGIVHRRGVFEHSYSLVQSIPPNSDSNESIIL